MDVKWRSNWTYKGGFRAKSGLGAHGLPKKSVGREANIQSFFRFHNRQKLPHCVSLPPGSKNVNSTKVLNCRAMFLYDKPYWMFWFDSPTCGSNNSQTKLAYKFLEKLIHLAAAVISESAMATPM